jgi:hypothetical protein
MTEPASTTAAAVATAVLVAVAPTAPDGALILLAGFIGSMHSISKAHTTTIPQGIWYVAKWTMTSLLLTGFVIYLIETYTGFPAKQWPGVVSFGITFFANKWGDWLTGIGEAVAARFQRRAG